MHSIMPSNKWTNSCRLTQSNFHRALNTIVHPLPKQCFPMVSLKQRDKQEQTTMRKKNTLNNLVIKEWCKKLKKT